jgi:hypothetical protein
MRSRKRSEDVTITPADIQAAMNEALQEALGELHAAFDAADAQRQAVADARRPYDAAAELKSNPISLVTRALEREGLSAAQILRDLTEKGLEGHKDILQRELDIERNEQARVAEIERLNSPENRLAEAKAAETARAEAARTGQLARVYLTENAETIGITADMVDSLSDSEAATLAFGSSSEGSEGGEA